VKDIQRQINSSKATVLPVLRTDSLVHPLVL
jgi:hypothetical protein